MQSKLWWSVRIKKDSCESSPVQCLHANSEIEGQAFQIASVINPFREWSVIGEGSTGI